MRYPSELLHNLADTLDDMEDALEDRYAETYNETYMRVLGAKRWISGWRVWEWREHQERLEGLKERHEGLLNDYYELCELYTKETGKEPPLSVWAGLSSFERGLSSMVRRMRENLQRISG